MSRTLADLKSAADQRLAAGHFLDALRPYRLLLEASLHDFDTRMLIADCLLGMGQARYAAGIYTAVAVHDIKFGNPLQAMVAIKLLESFGNDVAELVAMLVGAYSRSSRVLGRSVKPAPVEYTEPIRDEVTPDFQIEEERLIKETTAMAMDLSSVGDYPPLVPPVPIFSVLEEEAFTSLFRRLRLRRHGHQESVIVQGLPGDAVYFLASGYVEAIRANALPDGTVDKTFLARLGPGTLFGEMALISADPRSASVVCDGPADTLELRREDVDTLSEAVPQIRMAMAAFTRDRMINNLLTTHPMFKPFDEGSRKQLLARFTGHDVPGGTIFLEQGTVGPGLYVILRGQAEVLRWNGTEYVKLADLGPGDVAGEMSLLHEEPVSATVQSVGNATLLFLARELFMPLVDAVPELLAHFARLAEARRDDTEKKLQTSVRVEESFCANDLVELPDDEEGMV
ncbi:MAG: cyclic nucleotide-binding domain-containing protein [Myxococcota bacterium]|jgi:CRP-like cAMP-binding protein|nr:cyclic nucleotide-binding domain-containing protein [Myxococcota bacterium]